MADIQFATETFYLVLQKRRREAQLASAQPDQSHHRLQPIAGSRLDLLTERLTGEPTPLVYECGDGLRHGR